MRTWTKRFGVVLAIALVAIMAIAGVSFAQSGDTNDWAPQGIPGVGPRGGHGIPGLGLERPGQADRLQDLADTFGMTVEELQAALDEGKTIQQIAEEQGVDLYALHLQRSVERARDHLQAAADTLNMTVDELLSALDEGKTIQQIAEEQGVDLQAAWLEQVKSRLAQAVEDGKLTQEQADQILERLESGEMPFHPFGPGGRRGPGGHRGGGFGVGL